MTRGPFKLTIRVVGCVLNIPDDIVELHPSHEAAVRRAEEVGVKGVWRFNSMNRKQDPGQATYYTPAAVMRCTIDPPPPPPPHPPKLNRRFKSKR